MAYLDGGKVNVKGMVTDVFKLDDYQAALDKMNSRTALKIAIVPSQAIFVSVLSSMYLQIQPMYS